MLWNADIDAGNYNKQCNLQRLSDDLRLVFFCGGIIIKLLFGTDTVSFYGDRIYKNGGIGFESI